MTLTHSIAFGTSGYRGIIDETFTRDHVVVITRSIGQWLIDRGYHSVAIGYDPRRGNGCLKEDFPGIAAEVLSDMGLMVCLSKTPVPTPLISWVVKTQGVGGGLVFTASHNPPEYNGLKFNPPPGGPATTDITGAIEKGLGLVGAVYGKRPGQIVVHDWIFGFSQFLSDYVRTLYPDYRPMVVTVDCRYGTAGPIWNRLSDIGFVTIASLLHADPLSNFGGIEPNPTSAVALKDLAESTLSHHSVLGVGHDPDADRHAICDENGSPVLPEIVAAIVLIDWVDQGIAVDGIASTVASSGLLRAICDQLDKHYYETAVGFKYFAPYFEKATTRVIGVESSGGFSVSDYLYEKCGFLPALLIGAIAGRRNVPVSALVEDVWRRVGRFEFRESRFEFLASRRNIVIDALNAQDSIEGQAAPLEINSMDGKKWRWADGSWLLIRLSGTEPIGRIYAESASESRTRELIQAAQDWAVKFK